VIRRIAVGGRSTQLGDRTDGTPAASVDHDRPATTSRVRRAGLRADSVDVLVENNLPATSNSAVSATHAAARHPALIWCAITGFGQDGPTQWPGHDITYLGQSGLLAAPSHTPLESRWMVAVPIGRWSPPPPSQRRCPSAPRPEKDATSTSVSPRRQRGRSAESMLR
jgi:hypothetical protein